MSDFRTEARVDLTVSDREAQKVRSTLEAAATDVPATIDAAADGGAASGGGTSAQRRRELLSEGIDLDVRRNELLEQLLTATEEGDFSRANRSGGRLGLLAGGAAVIGTALAGITSAVSNFSLDAPDLSPGNLVDGPVALEPKNVVDGPVALEPKNVVDAADVGAGDVVGGSVTTEQILAAAIASPAAITVKKLIESKAGVDAASLIKSRAGVVADDLVNSEAGIVADDLVKKEAKIAAKNLVNEKADIGAGDVVSGTISAKQLLAAVVGTGTALGAGAAAATGKLGSGGGPGGGAPAGAGAGGIGFPAIPALLGREGARARKQPEDQRNIIEDFLADLTPNLGGTQRQALEAQTGQQIEQSAGGVQRAQPANETQVEVTTNVEGTGGISEREAKRIADKKAQEVKREIERKIDQ